MKTSFYLALWAIIILLSRLIIPYEYIPNVEITYITTIIIVTCLYWIINHTRSAQEYFLYETKLQRIRTFESIPNIYESNTKRLSFYFLWYLTIVYFGISVIAITWTLFCLNVKDWWIRIDWLGLITFFVFATLIIIRGVRVINNRKSSNHIVLPDVKHQEEYINHVKSTMSKNFYRFNLLNMIFGIFSIILGLLVLSSAVYLFVTHEENRAIGLACIFYLYGSLATYFGIKDIITISQYLKANKSLITDEK